MLKILIQMSVHVLGISGRRNCLRTWSWNKLVINGISWKRKKIETILFRIIINLSVLYLYYVQHWFNSESWKVFYMKEHSYLLLQFLFLFCDFIW